MPFLVGTVPRTVSGRLGDASLPKKLTGPAESQTRTRMHAALILFALANAGHVMFNTGRKV
jgi:hypothetical protein